MPHNHTTKRCSKCGEVKPRTTEYFAPRKDRKAKFQSWCRTCQKSHRQKRYHENPDKFREAAKAYQKANPQKVHEYNVGYYRKNIERMRKRAKDYYWQDPEKHRTASLQYIHNHPTDPDKVRQRVHLWRKQNPDKHNANNQNRRAKANNLPATLTHTEWEDIKAAYGYACAYCGKAWFEIDGVLQQEHVIPLSQGGGYTADNIVPACQDCNSRKHDKTPEQAGMLLRPLASRR